MSTSGRRRIAGAALIMLLGVVATEPSISRAATPPPTVMPETRVPPDDCLGRTYTCAARLSFTVGRDGRPTKINVLNSSGSYPCDRALVQSLGARRYPQQADERHIEEDVVGYRCVAGRPTQSVFTAVPLRENP